MTPFNPKHPHGHMRRDGCKAEILRTLENGRHAVLLTSKHGVQWLEMYQAGGGAEGYPYDDNFLINAPAPKRTWEVVAVETSDGGVVFLRKDSIMVVTDRIIGRYTLTEGQGMEEKDG